MNFGRYPLTRLRRNRKNSWTRSVLRESHFSIEHLIWPIFIQDDECATEKFEHPYLKRFSLKDLPHIIPDAFDLGIRAIMIFPVISQTKKNSMATACLDQDGILPRAIQCIKAIEPSITIMTDPALDPYTSHGQDGLIEDGCIVNDKTIELLKKFSLLQAHAGSDVIAPSEMMDGRIHAIRRHLDDHNFTNLSLISYAAKYASALYGPFRAAVGSSSCLSQGDKKTYQMDPANSKEAIREVALDIQEGADMIIIKPGLSYLDIIRTISNQFPVPVIAYHVSGEYTMLKSACDQKLLNYEETLLEHMTCFKRAGASAVITYAALDVAKSLSREKKHF